MNSDKKSARIAGLLFLILIITGVFAEFFVRAKIYLPNDAAATVKNIINNERLFRLSIISDMIMIIAFLLFPLFLYSIFKKIHKNLTAIMVICVLISVSIYGINMLNQIAVLLLTSNDTYLSAFEADQLSSLVMFFLKMHANGYFISQIFYGLYLLPLGYMIYKSGILPKIIGIILMLGGIGDLIDFIRYYLFPDYQSIILNNITIPADLGEFSFCLWLLIMGVKDLKSPNARLASSA